jgi:tetratricopeptide (TPR) repeat protein
MLELSAREEACSLALSHFAVGLLHNFAHEPDSPRLAEQHLREALRLAPRSPLVAETLIFPLLMQRDFAGVVEVLRPALEAHPGEPHLVMLTAEALQLAAQEAEAIACLEKGLTDGKWSSGTIFRQLFTLLWQKDRGKEAERLLRQTARKPGLQNTFDYRYTVALHGNLRAEQARSPRRWQRLRADAVGHARRAAELAGPDTDPEDVAVIANLLVEAEEWQAARCLVERLADEFDAPDLWLLKARLLLRDGENDSACAYLAELVVYYLPDERFPEVARLLFEAGEAETAIRIFTHYLTQDPESLFARLQLAWLHHETGQTEQGIAALMPMLASLPPEALLRLAHLNHSLERDSLALLAAEQAAATAKALNRNEFLDVDYYLFVASLHDNKGNYAAALQAARSALALEPENPLCANFVGYLLAEANQELDTAESLIRSALVNDPDNAAFLDSLAWALHRQGRREEALAAILHALRSEDEPDGVILDHAGDICAALHLADLARLYWASALATDDLPEPKTTRRKISELAPVDAAASNR